MPVVQQVQLLNTDGTTTNSFDFADDGILNIGLGSFSFHSFTPEGAYLPETWFECASATPIYTISYAAHETDEWYPLTMTELENEFYPEGMGHFLTCSLKEVSVASESGWYDLKVEIETSDGNLMTQKFGPLFYIKNTISSIEKIVDSTMDSGNSGSLPNDALVYDINGVLQNSSNLKPGVYVVRYGESFKKIIVK